MVINRTVPANPIKTPNICLLEEYILKAKKPKIMVLIGTIEFNIEAIALSISVSAYANKKAGKNVPKNPDMAIHLSVFFGKFFKLLNPAKNNNNAVMIILKEPNCNGVKPTSPFLININELPHIRAKRNKNIHLLLF